jgi:hypothetical protein
MRDENLSYLAAIVGGLVAGLAVLFALLHRALEQPVAF